jgi:hypothetical protein
MAAQRSSRKPDKGAQVVGSFVGGGIGAAIGAALGGPVGAASAQGYPRCSPTPPSTRRLKRASDRPRGLLPPWPTVAGGGSRPPPAPAYATCPPYRESTALRIERFR